MNSLERVGLILQHKEADRVPVYPIANSVSRKTLGLTYEEWTKDVDLCAKAIIKITEDFDFDVITTLVDLSVEAADWGQPLIYYEDKAAAPDSSQYLIQSAEDYKKIKKINPRETKRMSEHIELCQKLVAAKGKETPIVAFVFAPLGIATMMRGAEQFFMDLIRYPDEVHQCLRAITDTLKDLCTALIETGVHAIMFDTLYASKSIMSKKMWDSFEGIYMEELSQHVKEQGCMVMLHNCGNGAYFDRQIERMDPIAISFLHMPDDCTSMEELKEKYGSKLTLIGHVDPPSLMLSTPEEIEAICKEQIDAYKSNGGFILATGCEYPAPLELDMAELMVRVAKEYGKY